MIIDLSMLMKVLDNKEPFDSRLLVLLLSATQPVDSNKQIEYRFWKINFYSALKYIVNYIL